MFIKPRLWQPSADCKWIIFAARNFFIVRVAIFIGCKYFGCGTNFFNSPSDGSPGLVQGNGDRYKSDLFFRWEEYGEEIE